jgi:NAD(P)-dependent dehydrogenase (short-subunit alcohol dehydrogenase family)
VKAEQFSAQMVEIMALPPAERHERMAALHTSIVTVYRAAVEALTEEQATRIVSSGAETRTVAQVVGHIAEWERFAILGAGDMLAGLTHPRMVTSIAGYYEPDGQAPAFDTIDAFNAYQAAKHAAWPWTRIQALALDTATTVHALFTEPRLLSAARLEATEPFRKRLEDGTRIRNITMGWNLWMTVLEHEAVEHAEALGMVGGA